jgi:hypothetical protein
MVLSTEPSDCLNCPPLGSELLRPFLPPNTAVSPSCEWRPRGTAMPSDAVRDSSLPRPHPTRDASFPVAPETRQGLTDLLLGSLSLGQSRTAS